MLGPSEAPGSDPSTPYNLEPLRAVRIWNRTPAAPSCCDCDWDYSSFGNISALCHCKTAGLFNLILVSYGSDWHWELDTEVNILLWKKKLEKITWGEIDTYTSQQDAWRRKKPSKPLSIVAKLAKCLFKGEACETLLLNNISNWVIRWSLEMQRNWTQLQ